MTYTEINSALKRLIPKSTLATWCKDVDLPKGYKAKVKKLNEHNFLKMRQIYIKNKDERKRIFYGDLSNQNKSLFKLQSENLDAQKITLAILYLAEGSKSPRGSLMFGNSDPLIVGLFVGLMRKCYKIDESKFRCTVQCRADQNINELEQFWSKITGIDFRQFYKARVDKRTIGQISRKKDYKGVCRIDYFSSAIDLELKYIAKVIVTMGL